MPKASQQAELLWPYLLPKIQRAVGSGAGGSSGSAGVGGAPTPHALSSSHHTGVLTNSQAPQFLLVDGSRTLMGNLDVFDGVTIDGVDLSVHVLDPNAHHDTATAGDGIDIVGQLVSVDLATTSGLQFSGGELLVGAGDGIEVLANSVAVDLATNSGLTFSSGDLALGTPATLTPSTTNSVTTTTHSHDITSSSDVGTSAPGVNTLLHATSTGSLILGALTVKGNVDVTNGGDLTVGSNVLFVDVSQSSVGIMRAPDPQFALDVNGPIRGTELVGRHAIQLDDVALLLHYDGGFPYTTNYTGEPNAVPMGTVPIANTNVHYRPGKFYKAAVFGTSGTNLIPNPSFETNLTGWTAFSATGTLSASLYNVDSWYGSWCARLAWTTETGFFHTTPVASSVAGDYTFSVWLTTNAPRTVRIYISHDTLGTIYGTKDVLVTEEWQHFYVTGTVPAGVPLRCNIRVDIDASGGRLHVDGAQMQQTSTPTWYMDGSLGTGYAWTGTAHASTSTRANGSMTYLLPNMVSHRWTVMGYFRWPSVTPPLNKGALEMVIGSSADIRIYTSTGLRVSYDTGSGDVALDAGVSVIDTEHWYHVAITYTPANLKVYVDGVLAATASPNFGTAIPASLLVGAIVGPIYGDVMVDDLCVSRQALSAERVKAIFESDAPVFATSSVFTFRATPKGLVWADEEGLWMRDVDGTPVMGFYGGEAATKSWGGFTLARGDIVFGQYGASDGGWFVFDRDGVSAKPYLSLGYSDKTVLQLDTGGASLNGVLDITTTGGIYQGTGSFASPSTGLKVWNQSGIGRIGGYNSGTAQWYANTDGKLYAGGGTVALDASGVHVYNASSERVTINSEGLVVDHYTQFTAGAPPQPHEFGEPPASAPVAGSAYRSLYGSNDMFRIYASEKHYELEGGPFADQHYYYLDGVIEVPNIAAPADTGSDETWEWSQRLWLRVAGNDVVIKDDGVYMTGALYVSEINSDVTLTGHMSATEGFTANQASTTAAIPCLTMFQADVSEPFMLFTGTTGASNAISNAALGAYYRKLRVSINGVEGWIPVHS